LADDRGLATKKGSRTMTMVEGIASPFTVEVLLLIWVAR
jgi:hypothetical protein